MTRHGAAPRVSMADVARAAGVSAQTVSRVANASPHVDPQTRARVEAAMAALGYRPHRAARALRTGRTQTVGLVASTLASVGNSRMLQAVADAAAARSYALVVLTIGADGDIRAAFDRLRDQGVDGVVVLNEATELARATTLPHGLPLVVVDSPPDDRFAIVQTDHAGGAQAATAHLLAQGHRVVHHLAGPEHSFAAAERERGWVRAHTAAGVVPPPPMRGDWTARSGYECGRVLAADSAVTAVFAANDQMALGLLRALAEAGRGVPGEVGVIGFDDLPDAAQYLPPLSTVRQDFDALGERIVQRLVSAIETGPDDSLDTIAAQLVVRASTVEA